MLQIWAIIGRIGQSIYQIYSTMNSSHTEVWSLCFDSLFISICMFCDRISVLVDSSSIIFFYPRRWHHYHLVLSWWIASSSYCYILVEGISIIFLDPAGWQQHHLVISWWVSSASSWPVNVDESSIMIQLYYPGVLSCLILVDGIIFIFILLYPGRFHRHHLLLSLWIASASSCYMLVDSINWVINKALKISQVISHF